MLIYISLDQALETHANTVRVSGGGLLGVIDQGKLDSILCHIQNDDYYPTFEEKLTHLFYATCKLHAFQDGNKRIAIALCAQMLLINGYMYCIGSFMQGMENISYHVAASRINKDLLSEIITAIIMNESDNEELKLKIYNAINSE